MKTKTVFLYNKKNDDLFALFLDNEQRVFKQDYFFTSYSHIGQHSDCALDYVKECRFALPKEYEGLKNELTNLVGYDLQVFNDDETSFDFPAWIKGKFQPMSEDRAQLRRNYWKKRKDKTFKIDWEYFLFICELQNL